MIRSLIKIALLLVVGILVYNFFFGSAAEKESSRNVFRKGGELISSVVGIVKDEGKKFEKGKYDDALDKVGNLFSDLKDKAQDLDEKYVDRIADLERKRRELERELEEIQPETYDQVDADSEFTPKGDDKKKAKHFERELDELMKETKSLMNEMRPQ